MFRLNLIRLLDVTSSLQEAKKTKPSDTMWNQPDKSRQRDISGQLAFKVNGGRCCFRERERKQSQWVPWGGC